MEWAVEVEDMTVAYTTKPVLWDVDMKVPIGSLAAIVGPNGAGKSTTMNIICGVLKQTEGNVFIKGIDMRDNPVEAKRHIGFLPQKPPLHTDLTVEEYLTYCARLRLMDARIFTDEPMGLVLKAPRKPRIKG